MYVFLSLCKCMFYWSKVLVKVLNWDVGLKLLALLLLAGIKHRSSIKYLSFLKDEYLKKNIYDDNKIWCVILCVYILHEILLKIFKNILSAGSCASVLVA